MIHGLDPVALPLWAVLLFAVAMYPLGLLLPGCLCCGGGNCSTCKDLATSISGIGRPYEQQGGGPGRMCCSGQLVSQVTLRVTNLGAATLTQEYRHQWYSDGVRYNKITNVFNCGELDGDYVLQGYGPNTYGLYGCAGWQWSNGESDFYKLVTWEVDAIDESGNYPPWPGWSLRVLFRLAITGSTTQQTCSGYPGPETCGLAPIYSPGWVEQAGPPSKHGQDYELLARTGVFNEQSCNPAPVLIEDELRPNNFGWNVGQAGQPRTGCAYRVELV